LRRRILLTVALIALLAAGGASAALLIRTITLGPGQCKRIRLTRVCARRVAPRTVTVARTATVTTTRTATVTVTVAPSPIGRTFSGNGSKTLAPLTLSRGVTASWTSKPDSSGYNYFSVSGSSADNWVSFDNGNSSTSGTSYIPPGTYTFDVSADGAWTLSF
jgi:hypothetical protein